MGVRTEKRGGKVRVLLDYYPEPGNRKTRVQRVFPGTEAEARRWLREFKARKVVRKRQAWGLAGAGGFADLAREFCAAKEVAGCAPGYLAELRRVLAGTMAERWGTRDAAKVSPEDVDRWLGDRRAAGAADNTLAKERRMLGTLYRWAVKRRRLAANPVDAVDAPRVAQRAIRWLLPAEFARLWKAAHQLVRPLLVPAAVLGLRSAEVCGLARADVRGGAIHIVGKGGKLRVLPCPGPLAALLLRQPKRADGLVFTRPDLYHGRKKESDRWTRHSFLRAVMAAARGAGLDGVGVHTLRHTATSWLVAAGVPMRRVQRLLGHASITTTERYEHAGYLDWPTEAAKLPKLVTTISLQLVSLLVRAPSPLSATAKSRKRAKSGKRG